MVNLCICSRCVAGSHIYGEHMCLLMDLQNLDIILCTMIFVVVVIFYVSVLDESCVLLIYFRWWDYMLQLHGQRNSMMMLMMCWIVVVHDVDMCLMTLCCCYTLRDYAFLMYILYFDAHAMCCILFLLPYGEYLFSHCFHVLKIFYVLGNVLMRETLCAVVKSMYYYYVIFWVYYSRRDPWCLVCLVISYVWVNGCPSHVLPCISLM